MRMDDFDYELPLERIAQWPADQRDASRLLVVDRAAGSCTDSRFDEIGVRLRPDDLLVVNETEVFPARLRARRASGAEVEILLVRPRDGLDPESAEGREWDAMAGPGRKAKPGDALVLLDRSGAPAPDATVEILDRLPTGGRRVRLDVPGDPWDWIAAHGHVPLPPYIGRPDEPLDRERYQTVYARRRGAIAAPTAGLHFTPELLDRLSRNGVRRAAVTLHVGPGTFRPVTAERAEDHRVEAEWYRIGREAAAALADARARGGRVVAVGTTVVRALESAARGWKGGPAPAEGWTELFVRPGHEFRWVDVLLTNFHLPRSTLLLLVSAFAGRDLVLEAYRHAVRSGYRFYSYGDAMLIV
ncbi:MAG TPA: tRNA preQ1(34) S-adenosylmethionine ribosyltransferase-isomerase QueA [Gemmatimonadota bacterium]|nr:tRNA preQ1(34) S-adenosylmethionine ribosyltransferase-isomerase QueA [Gemmatimonadota bacterium]